MAFTALHRRSARRSQTGTTVSRCAVAVSTSSGMTRCRPAGFPIACALPSPPVGPRRERACQQRVHVAARGGLEEPAASSSPSSRRAGAARCRACPPAANALPGAGEDVPAVHLGLAGDPRHIRVAVPEHLAQHAPPAGPRQQGEGHRQLRQNFRQRREVGSARAGRLVAPDQGFGEDVDVRCRLVTSVSTEARRPPKRPPCTLSTTSASWPGLRIQLQGTHFRDVEL